MKTAETRHDVEAWTAAGLQLERHRYPPGPAGEAPAHVHDRYQLCLSLDFPGEYRYRGDRYPVPVHSLSVIHPGEVHAARDPIDRSRPATFQMIYLEPAAFAATAADLAGRAVGLPSFADPIICDADLAARFGALHAAAAGGAPRLVLNDGLLGVLAPLLARHAAPRVRPGAGGSSPAAVRVARDYLIDRHAEDVSLAHLAELTGLSPFHLVRVFRGEVGMPPHAFQVAVRVERARGLLLAGEAVASVAAATGFADQSHLTRHFKRLVGVPPGRYRYAPRKNVQDGDR